MALVFKKTKKYRSEPWWLRFRRWMRKPRWWNHFWYQYHWNGIIGPGAHSSRSLREGRVALVIAIIGIIILLTYITTNR